jgi:hypothetical protein
LRRKRRYRPIVSSAGQTGGGKQQEYREFLEIDARSAALRQEMAWMSHMKLLEFLKTNRLKLILTSFSVAAEIFCAGATIFLRAIQVC